MYGRLAGSTISDMLVVGDIRDLTVEGQKLVSGEDMTHLLWTCCNWCWYECISICHIEELVH
jgi:hypothetical protein